MAFTQAQLDALDAALAQGSLRVRMDGKEVEYRSLDEMLRLRGLMATDVAGATPAARVAYATFERS